MTSLPVKNAPEDAPSERVKYTRRPGKCRPAVGSEVTPCQQHLILQGGQLVASILQIQTLLQQCS